jgi:mitosis inhibitor protein kinase SWE1
VDPVLLARFDRVERVGHGEFSDVYRVVEQDRTSQANNGYFSTPTHHTPPTPSSDKLFAVKKLRLPIKGAGDRALRMREVNALQHLRNSEHVVHLLDSWEERNNLYIQTEYCEEGSLDAFLANVGLKGRLDDFRIWKIMLEIGQVSSTKVAPSP